ncbi:MAG: SPOR domain-containing protein [Gammaproteobacteria bacterium]
MDLSLKQRLIGGAVIVALAVIFVPMLLDGSGQREQTTVNIEIPPEPAFTFEQQQPSVGGASGSQEPAVAKPLPEPGGSGSHTTPPAPVVTPEPQPEQTAAAAPETAPETPARAAPAPATGGAGSWVVQVGSFSKQNNAIVLNDKLRAAGFKSFVEPNGEGEQKVYRVKVGPEAGRDGAKALEARLLAEHKLKGIVVSHK